MNLYSYLHLNVVCFSFVCHLFYAVAVIVECMKVDALYRFVVREAAATNQWKHSNRINILFSPRHSLSREEIEMCATEAILAVLMVCIIHIDEPNRIGI